MRRPLWFVHPLVLAAIVGSLRSSVAWTAEAETAKPPPPPEEILVEELPPPPKEQYDVSTTLGWIGVRGNRSEFREQYGLPDGWNGGLENYFFRELLDTNRVFEATARALRNDYKVTLSLERTNLGFAHMGWEQYPEYYNSVGGYYPTATPPAASLNRDLRLDLGQAWTEFGLTLPSWPSIVLGYEYRYKAGAKSLTAWLPTTNILYKNILPNAKAIDEAVHVIRLDLSHDLRGFLLTDNFRYEFYDLKTTQGGAPADQIPGPVVWTQEGQNSKQWANALQIEKQWTDWWQVSAGCLSSHVNGEASFSQTTVNALDQPTPGYFWHAPALVLENASHMVNLNTQLGPWRGLSGAAGVQTEWAWQRGYGQVEYNVGIPGLDAPGTVDANLNRVTIEETLALRYTTIPFTVLFADGRLRQESLSQYQEQLGGNRYAFQTDTDSTTRWVDLRGGFRFAPWRPLSLNAHYRFWDRTTDFDHLLDQTFDPLTPSGLGYPAFITARDTCTDEVEARLVWRPRNWLQTSASYRFLSTDYRTTTDSAAQTFPGGITWVYTPGGSLLSGTYDAHLWSLNAALTPIRRLRLAVTFSYMDSVTKSAIDDVHAVVPYEGNTYTVLSSANYVLSKNTDLMLTYAFSSANYGQEDALVGLPAGIDYQRHAVQASLTRRFWTRFLFSLRYGFFYYDEPTSGHYNDYTANAVFATLSIRVP
jgi:hypothetical protein